MAWNVAFAAVVLSLFSFYGTSMADLSSEYKNKASLHSDYMLYWTHNASAGVMNIATEVKTTGWVGFGFTKARSNSMDNYDVCIGNVSGNTSVLRDYLTKGHTAPTPDSQNDCILTMASESGGTTTMKFHKKVNTGDSKDIPIEKGKILVVWAYKRTDRLAYHDERGFMELTMIPATDKDSGFTAHLSQATAIVCILIALMFQ